MCCRWAALSVTLPVFPIDVCGEFSLLDEHPVHGMTAAITMTATTGAFARLPLVPPGGFACIDLLFMFFP